MPIITPADFRPQTHASWCSGLELTASQAPDADLTVGIATISQRVEDLTNDFFTKQAGLVLEHDVVAPSQRLYLLRRCTAVTTVKTRYIDGTLTTQDANAYRLHSSLDAAGAVQVQGADYLEITNWGVGIVGTYFGPWVWPVGVQAVQVTGDFGWTVTPGDIKRAVALMTWDLFYKSAGELNRAKRFARGDLTVELATDSLTGIPEADEILKLYMHDSPVMIG